MSFFNIRNEGELIAPDLERRSFSTWLSDAVAKVVNSATRSWGVTGHDSVLIGEAWELWDRTGDNGLVGHEIALLTEPPTDGIARKRAGLNIVLKSARLDGTPPAGKRDVPNSTAVWLTAHPELRGESVFSAAPDALYGPAVDIPHNPGASLFRISADMLRGGGVPALVDAVEVNVPVVNAATPAFVVEQRDGSTWFCIRDYSPGRQEGLALGTGAFHSFQTKNADGKWFDTVLLNGGFIDMTPGKEQGDFDMLTYVDGKINGFAIVGNMTHLGGPAAGLLPIVDATMNVGGPNNRILDLFMAGRIHVDALEMPTVRKLIKNVWVDCIQVRTPAGWRYIEVHEAL